jgi:hypothetical protein
MFETQLCYQQREPMPGKNVNVRPLHLVLILAVSVLVLLIAYTWRLLATAGRVSPSANLISRSASGPKTTRLAAAQPIPPLCPPINTPMLQSSAQTSHHKVTLTWHASVSSPNKSDPAGYCLYRSTTPNPASENPPCKDCEKINKRAIPGTACIDDVVVDGALYYYVVDAISQAGVTSTFSNQAPAQIPATPKANGSVANYPMCRASNGLP